MGYSPGGQKESDVTEQLHMGGMGMKEGDETGSNCFESERKSLKRKLGGWVGSRKSVHWQNRI